MFDWIADPAGWAALVTLSAMEIVLGIDNVVFISVLVAKLPAAQAERARQVGLAMALVFRVLLLFALTSIMKLTAPVVTIAGQGISWRDIILLAGGLFPHRQGDARSITAGRPGERRPTRRAPWRGHRQIALIDLVFSVDSIVGHRHGQQYRHQIVAVIIAMVVMYVARASSGASSWPTPPPRCWRWLPHPHRRVVVRRGLGVHVPRGYIYFAMAFAAAVGSIRGAARASAASASVSGGDAHRARGAPLWWCVAPGRGCRHGLANDGDGCDRDRELREALCATGRPGTPAWKRQGGAVRLCTQRRAPGQLPDRQGRRKK
jgi:predicted tellurium resistance membrane protein TerC